MQDLQLIGVHEDGEHLLLSGADDQRFQVPIDEALRAAIRRDRPHFGRQKINADGELRPRDVQAMIRAGVSTDEAASRAGWSVDKVHRYEGPILAERGHVAGLAQQARLRSQGGVSGGGSAPTLSERVTERLRSRDVEMTEASWDSWRNEGGPWTVVLTFAAGGRQRQGSWIFDLADRTVAALDDEARWLSEEIHEINGPIPGSTRDTRVYDVEAEGGLRTSAREDHKEDPLDLMTAMRKRSSARGRRKPGGRTTSVGSPKEDSTSLSASGDDTREASSTPPDESLIVRRPIVEHPSEADPANANRQQGSTQAVTAVTAAEMSASQDQPKARPKRLARETTRKTGRPSVPAWDEIMFGTRPDAKRTSS